MYTPPDHHRGTCSSVDGKHFSYDKYVVKMNHERWIVGGKVGFVSRSQGNVGHTVPLLGLQTDKKYLFVT